MLQFLIMHVRRAVISGLPGEHPHANPDDSASVELQSVSMSDLRVETAVLAAIPGTAHEQSTAVPLANRSLGLIWLLICLPLFSAVGCVCLPQRGHDASVMAARQLSLRGIDAQQCQQWQDAQELFAEALQKNPADERAHLHYAQVMWQLGQRDTAVLHLEEAVRLSGEDPQLLVELGEMYLAIGNIAAAWECAEDATAANQHLARVWALRGEICRFQSKPDAALENFHRALCEQPHYPAVQLAIAAIYAQQNRPRRALSTLNTLESQLGPAVPPADLFYQQGLAYKALGRYEDAISALTEASQLAEQPSPDLHCHLAEAQLLAGNMASAKLAVQAALDRFPGHQPSIELESRIDSQARRLTAAVRP